METAGRSGRLRTRAKKRAITMESAPRSSKTCAPGSTVSTARTSASTSARPAATGSAAGGGPVPPETTTTGCPSTSAPRPRQRHDGGGAAGPRKALRERVGRLDRVQHVLAEEVLEPVGLVHGV